LCSWCFHKQSHSWAGMNVWLSGPGRHIMWPKANIKMWLKRNIKTIPFKKQKKIWFYKNKLKYVLKYFFYIV
jgi:hypothetical protein